MKKYDINDPEFAIFVEKGIPLEELEKRLKPASYEANKWKEDVENHAGFHDFSKEGFLGQDERLLDVIYTDAQGVADMQDKIRV